MAKLIEINGTIFSRHINKDITEEEFAELFGQFLKDNELLFDGNFYESNDDN